jgi:hypothetical protein
VRITGLIVLTRIDGLAGWLVARPHDLPTQPRTVIPAQAGVHDTAPIRCGRLSVWPPQLTGPRGGLAN